MAEIPETLTLTRRSDGRFCKRIDGVLHYFGRDEEEAKAALLDFIRLRRLARPSVLTDRVTVQVVAEAFAARCQERVIELDLTQGTLDDYDEAIAAFVAHVGPVTLVTSLRADQFASFRAKLWKRLGTKAFDRNIQAIRTMFKWAYENRVTDAIPRYGDKFKKSSPGDRGEEQAVKRAKHGERCFTADELKRIFAHESCKGDLRTFILLGLNAGLYSKDISDLDWSEIAYEDGVMVIERNRVKTKQRQKFVCWPEVRAAIESKRRKKSGNVFLTSYGNPWNQGKTDSILLLFNLLLDDAGAKRHGLGFGTFKHTHVSAVASLGDKDAARRVRGHRLSGIEHYYDVPSIERLSSITDHARRVLLLSNAPSSADWIVRTP